MKYRVLVAGGYGNFGGIICRELVKDPLVEVVVAGRSLAKAEKFCEDLQNYKPVNMPLAFGIDLSVDNIEAALREVHPDLLINTCGPFQQQDYSAARACIDFGVNYVDIADGRRFVCDFSALNDAAIRGGVLCVSGASTVPGVSSVVLDHYAKGFSEIARVNMAISPGNKSPRGYATVAAILSYTGKPFDTWLHGKWSPRYGWMDSDQLDFGQGLSARWVANVDVPDLELFPDRYKVRDSLIFRAGLELPLLHHSMSVMAKIAKKGWMDNWAKYAKNCLALSDLFRSWGTADGGMLVEIHGCGMDGKKRALRWRLKAVDNAGPKIPTASTIILTTKLARSELAETGAMPCLGLFTLRELNQLIRSWGITTYAEELD